MSLKYLILTVFIIFFIVKPVFGQDVIVNCNNEKCSSSSSNSLFSKGEIWFPGKTISKIIRIINSSNSLKSIKVSIQNLSSSVNLDKVLNLSVKRNSDNTLIWFGNIKYFSNGISLGDFEPNKSEDYIYKINMDKSTTNEYQNKKIDFDIIFEFRGDMITITPTIAKQLLGQNYISPAIDQVFIEPTAIGEVKGLETKNNDKLMFILKVIGIELIVIFGYLIFRFIFFKSR